MKVPSPYKCDECGEEKKATNHWYLLKLVEYPVYPGPPEFSPVTTSFCVYRWEHFHNMIDLDGTKHICSEACMSKQLSKWMRGALDSANAKSSDPAPAPEKSANAK